MRRGQFGNALGSKESLLQPLGDAKSCLPQANKIAAEAGRQQSHNVTIQSQISTSNYCANRFSFILSGHKTVIEKSGQPVGRKYREKERGGGGEVGCVMGVFGGATDQLGLHSASVRREASACKDERGRKQMRRKTSI